MSAIYNKIKTSLYPLHEYQKKISTVSKASSGFDEPEDFMTNEIIINVLDENNNNHIIDEEEAKPQIVTRCLITRSESVTSQPPRKVSNSAKISLFIDSVKEMNKNVLIPSILRDIEINGSDVSGTPILFVGCDLYTGYKLLNSVKNSLIYSNSPAASSNIYEGDSSKQLVKQHSVIENKKEYMKELSVDKGYSSLTHDSGPQSISSASSVNMDDDSSDSSIGVDVPDLAMNFYHHLHGLNTELERLMDAAKFISQRYEQNSFL